MKKNALKKLAEVKSLLCGVFSKREAVGKIGAGCRHVHSTKLGDRDPLVKQLNEATAQKQVPTYSWETGNNIQEFVVQSSASRPAVIQQIVTAAALERKRVVREKVESVVEELITNALYHAYRGAGGKEKYARRSSVTLLPQEWITVRFQLAENGGLFLSVTDQAGSLKFEDVADALHRCYETEAQIQNKDGGAGLGTYMIFDAVTHLKFTVIPGKSTTVSCWIADQRSFDPEHFSFGFFERR